MVYYNVKMQRMLCHNKALNGLLATVNIQHMQYNKDNKLFMFHRLFLSSTRNCPQWLFKLHLFSLVSPIYLSRLVVLYIKPFTSHRSVCCLRTLDVGEF